MKGDRGTRGLVHRNKKTLLGEDYTGNPVGVVAPWGGSAAAAPAVGTPPVLTLPMDDDDDGDKTAIKTTAAKRGGLRQAIASTKSLVRSQFKTIANHLAFAMEVFAGTRSLKAIVLDGVGGASVVPLPGVSVSASGDGSFGGDLGVGGTVTIGGRKQARMIASALITAGTGLAGSVGLDAVTPFTHSGTGAYSLKLAAAVADASKLVVHVTMSTIRGFTEGVAIDAQHIAVATYTTADVAVDTTCSVTVYEVL